VYIGCRQNNAASRGLLATAWLSCYQWERNKRELVADRIIDSPQTLFAGLSAVSRP